MTDDASQLLDVLRGRPPFDALDADGLQAAVDAARFDSVAAGDLVIDAFTAPTREVFVVLSGEVGLWHDADEITQPADERLERGGVFGYSAMLTGLSIGPRAVAITDVTLARVPARAVTGAFSSPRGAQFLAERTAGASRRAVGVPTYSLVDDLIVTAPLAVTPDMSIAEVARRMSDRDLAYAAVELPGGGFGLVTDAILRRQVVVGGLPGSTPVSEVMQPSAAGTVLGESAAEALIELLDRNAEFLLVTDHDGTLRGVIMTRDFVVSPATAGVALHEQIRRASTVEEFVERAHRVPGMLADALSRGLAASKVIAVNSAVVDSIVRRAIGLVFERHPDLSVDAFTWLSLGSNGRREAVLSSDVDSAVAFDDGLDEGELVAYRAAFGEIDDLLAEAGLSVDEHGATARRAAFSRRNAEWRSGAAHWLEHPERDHGAIMTSLLVDGRPIHGDPGLPAAAQVLREVREHPGTMRLLLRESLAQRAKLRSVREVLSRGPGSVDIKTHALLPIVNIARWAALNTVAAEGRTTERLRRASGSQMLPAEQASTLIEVFDVLQRLRLRYQLAQRGRGEPPSDLLVLDRLSPIDRSIVGQAVREIASVQRRMGNISAYLSADEWATRERG